MKQVAKNLTDHVDGFLLDKTFLIMDRDGKFTPEFQTVLKEAGVEPLLLPPQSLNLNTYAERFVRSIKEECLDRLIFFGEPMLHEAINSYLEHYHAGRNHQGIDNKLIDPVDDIGKADGEIVCRERLGGMLKFYHRKAAWRLASQLRTQLAYACCCALNENRGISSARSATKAVAKLSWFG